MTLPPWLGQLWDNDVRDRVWQDPRTTATTFLGWPRDRVFSHALEGGQADFDAPIGNLSAEDRCLLYALYNQRRHLDELGEAFGQLVGSDVAGTPIVVDLGCGPFTAGLALAGVIGSDRAFRYYGVDRAATMGRLGGTFAESARSRGGVHPDTTCVFHTALDGVNFGARRGDLKLVVASYLLASPTLDVDVLVAELLKALDRAGPGDTAILYTNSGKPGPNRAFPRFKALLCAAGFSVEVDERELFLETRNPKELRYALFVRPGDTLVAVRREPR